MGGERRWDGKGEGRGKRKGRGGGGARGGRPPPFRKFLDPPLLSATILLFARDIVL